MKLSQFDAADQTTMQACVDNGLRYFLVDPRGDREFSLMGAGVFASMLQPPAEVPSMRVVNADDIGGLL